MSDAANNPGTVPDQSHPSIPADATIILPVQNTLLFPGMVLPLTIGRPASIAAAQEAVRSGGKIGLLLQDDPAVEQPGPEHLRRVGTIAEVLRYVTSGETHYVICRGLRRFRVTNFSPAFPISSRASPRSAYPKRSRPTSRRGCICSRCAHATRSD